MSNNAINNKELCSGFSLISAEEPHWLLLGSMPGKASLEAMFYYAHPRNAFWPIMSSLTSLPADTEKQKIALVQKSGLILWDVLSECERKGSLDANIKSPTVNDFEQLFKRYSKLKTVVFNGQKAFQLFQKQVLPNQQIPVEIDYIVLPSTSPANAALKLEDKRLFWQEKLCHLL